MNTLEQWYWQLQECGDTQARQALLQEIHQSDADKAFILERMLDQPSKNSSFMELPDHAAGNEGLKKVRTVAFPSR